MFPLPRLNPPQQEKKILQRRAGRLRKSASSVNRSSNSQRGDAIRMSELLKNRIQSTFDFDEFESIENGDLEDLRDTTNFKYETSGRDVYQQVYRRACKLYSIEPCNVISDKLNLNNICLNYIKLNEKHITTLSIALVDNMTVTSLELQSCGLCESGCVSVCEMLAENMFINKLNISTNSIKSRGAESLRDLLQRNNRLTILHVDQNELLDRDAKFFCEILQINVALRVLSLAGNKFSIDAGALFYVALSQNDSIKELNLSWNSFRLDGAILLLEGMKSNVGLTELDLSWNGLSIEGADALSSCLLNNKTLQKLDVSANRFTDKCFKLIVEGMQSNTNLHQLKIGRNPISTDCVHDFLLRLRSEVLNKTGQFHTLTYVGLHDISVRYDSVQIIEELQQHKVIDVHYGGLVSMSTRKQLQDQNEVTHTYQPVFLLFEAMKKANLRVVDLFHNFDKDKSDTLSKSELNHGLTTMGIKLSKEAVELLMKEADDDNDGTITLSEMSLVQKKYSRKMMKAKTKQKPPSKLYAMKNKALGSLPQVVTEHIARDGNP